MLLQLGFRSLLRRPDLVYLTIATQSPSLYRDCVYVSLAHFFRIPVAIHLPARGITETFEHASPLSRRLIRYALSNISAAIALSESNRRDLRGLVPPERIRIVPNGLPDHSAGYRWQQPCTPPRIMFLSNLIREKGIFTLLSAARQLKDDGFEIALDFLGPWKDPETRVQFDQEVDRLGLRNEVRTPGGLYDQDKWEAFRRVDVFCFPSHYPNENTPNVLIEAMQFGIPIVSTLHAGIPDMLENGRAALLVPPRDPNALAEALARLISDPPLAYRLGDHARRTYEAWFSLERWERELSDALTAAAGPR